MNTSSNQTRECNPLGVYGPEEPPVPAALMWVALVHCYCLIVSGTLGNAVALCCVWRCPKTRRPMKVLLFNVFLPALLVCLVTRPIIGEVRAAILTCDSHRVSKTALKINTLMYSILAQIEVTSIAAVAVIRAASVWAPQRSTLELQGMVLLVTAICLYSTITGMGVLRLLVMGILKKSWSVTLISVLYFLNTTLPVLITAAAYILMVFVIQRNKRRLAASQQQARTVTVMDQATRAMLAVFISNLVFGLPHSIHHVMGKQPHYMKILFHVLFSTHFVVDPLAFVWFNSGYRKRVLSRMRKLTQFISPPPSSIVPTESVSGDDHHHQSGNDQDHQSFMQKQGDVNI